MLRSADYLLTFLACLASYIIAKRRNKRLKLPLPPGPKGHLLLGNLMQMPAEFEWKQYHEWCKEFVTDVLYLNLAGTDVIVLDSSKAATDLLESRSSLYSGRARLPMIRELMGWDFNVGFMDYGPFWRKHRKLIHHSFHPVAAKQFRPHITKATHKLLNRLLDDRDPLQLMQNLRHMAGETVLSMAYGLEVQEKDDPKVINAEAAVHSLVAAAVPGTFLVDALPLLKHVPEWLPGASFQRKAREWRVLARRMVESPYAAAKKALQAGATTISIVSSTLHKIDDGVKDEAFTEDVIQNVAGTLYAAGTDTTVSAITTCILGLLENPQVLKKAQAQLDAVVKPGYLPDFDDEPSLPYITAIAQEAMRWRDVTPIAIPHLLDTEDEYKGYRLPAGAIIIPNAWAMLHSEEVYSDPFTFKPDRFINPETGKLDYTRARDPSHACWGFGRRICPGRFMAFSAVWLAIATLISSFNIEKAKVKVKNKETGEEEEKDVEVPHDYISALVIMPKPFKCVIKPRSQEKEDLIRASLFQGDL